MRALTLLLGEGYRVHPHCRSHWRQRGAKTSMWHVDAYKGTSWSSGRQHEPHWVMVCYYPQATTLGMGPTELLPGTQHLRGDSDREHYSRGHIPDFGEQMEKWASAPHAVLCEAGSIVVMHFDLWHRALETTDADASRLMLKFVAWRTAPPPAAATAPPWPLAERRCAVDGDPLLAFLAPPPVVPPPRRRAIWATCARCSTPSSASCAPRVRCGPLAARRSAPRRWRRPKRRSTIVPCTVQEHAKGGAMPFNGCLHCSRGSRRAARRLSARRRRPSGASALSPTAPPSGGTCGVGSTARRRARHRRRRPLAARRDAPTRRHRG